MDSTSVIEKQIINNFEKASLNIPPLATNEDVNAMGYKKDTINSNKLGKKDSKPDPAERDTDDSNANSNADSLPISDWKVVDVVRWATQSELFSPNVIRCLQKEEIDGQVLLNLNENDVRELCYRLNYKFSFGETKKLWIAIRGLQRTHHGRNASIPGACIESGFNNNNNNNNNNSRLSGDNNQANLTGDLIQETSIESTNLYYSPHTSSSGCGPNNMSATLALNNGDPDNISPPMSVDGRATSIPNDFFKTFVGLGYSFLVTWITSFVMVIVHERVPDMKKYPPLPDIFLDNVPHIPWAFHMCEITGTLLFIIWVCVCIFHKHRMVLLRRFFALAGTVFLLRCVTMLITSLSVPGTHLQCDQSDYAIDDNDLTLGESLQLRVSRAYIIWSGLGMSIQGVRTCGDYMFSGHTIALTLLNFCITEYTPRNLYFLHTMTWLLNMFGIFFILAAHEHYSIDVFVAFYITSRLFLYYHTLANNQALMSQDSTRTRIWFPMFSYFESSVDGIIPNEYDTINTILENLWKLVVKAKDFLLYILCHLWINPPKILLAVKGFMKSVFFGLSGRHRRNVSTSTQSADGVASSTSLLLQENWNATLTLNSSEISSGTMEEKSNRIFNHKDIRSTDNAGNYGTENSNNIDSDNENGDDDDDDADDVENGNKNGMLCMEQSTTPKAHLQACLSKRASECATFTKAETANEEQSQLIVDKSKLRENNNQTELKKQL